MSQDTVDLTTRRIFKKLDNLRGIHPGKDKQRSEEYEFVVESANAIISENGLENSVLGQVLARDLSWAMAEEAYLQSMIFDGGEPLYFEDELHPLFYALESVREHIRELTKIILNFKRNVEK